MNVFASWSGGKDCTLATYKAMAQGHSVLYLLNFIADDGERSVSHGIKASVLVAQSEAIGIPLIQMKTAWGEYENNFKKVVGELKEKGITAGVFGDIYLAEHREWIERVCGETGIQAIFPLWGSSTLDLIGEFLELGFKSLIVATQAQYETLLGQSMDRDLVNRLIELGSDPCGEGGEYHTLVTSGPIFKKGLEITTGKREKRDNVWFLDISLSA
ncbi:MAG: diphthine--ammonia ligase [Dehalococcoidia bacterium]